MNIVSAWFRRHFSDPQAILLSVLLVLGFGVVLTIGDILAPVLASMVIAYLLDSLVRLLERFKVPRLVAVIVAFLLFVGILVLAFFGLIPELTRQITQLVQLLPAMIAKGQEVLLQLPKSYPQAFSEQQVLEMIVAFRTKLAGLGEEVVSYSINSVVNLLTLTIYLVLVPILVFFFLKDSKQIAAWFSSYLPEKRSVAKSVWHEMDAQLGNYVRGKAWEIAVVWLATYLVFIFLGLKFAMLLAFLVGISVIVPYVGAVLVTFPVALVAYFQWGWSGEFATLLISYLVIQGLDGNVLVPLLFAGVNNLHPVAIIVAVLVFGGVWGVWGVFFAIPLATLIRALVNAWPVADG